jgi:ubiquinone/menaquinone biosynthesis C-methylase UbiE
MMRLKNSGLVAYMAPENTLRRHCLRGVFHSLLPRPESVNAALIQAPEEAADSPGKNADLESARYFLAVSERAGYPLAAGAKILDFGCGAGRLVRGFMEIGLDAYGYDISYYLDEASAAMPERFSFFLNNEKPTWDNVIDWSRFSLPYPDDCFDAVFTSQVFEHIKNHDLVIQEFARVLKPEGCSINIFPPRNYPFEHHLRIPFGYTIHSKPYYYVMALLGFRNEHQVRLDAKAVAENYYKYVENGLNYLSNSQLLEK